MRLRKTVACAFVFPTLFACASWAQGPDRFLGSVGSPSASPEEISLTLREAIQRGLKFNLAVVLGDAGILAAEGTRWKALAGLLPHVGIEASASSQQINLAAFGFSGFPGISPIVGPFGITDLRATLSQPILDMSAIYNSRSAAEGVRSATSARDDAKDTVVTVVAGLYLELLAAESRVTAAQAQVATARALYEQAVDLKKAGVAPGIDVLRAQVELESEEQRLIVVRNDWEKQRFRLARAIGLSLNQRFRLADQNPEAATAIPTAADALAEALDNRADYKVARSRLLSARSALKAAHAERLPSLSLRSDYGTIGPNPTENHGTYSVAARLSIPLFQGGREKGDVLEKDALARQRTSELEDLKGRIEMEVRSAILDVQAAGERVAVARRAHDLAEQQLLQARDRFAAGVTTNLEVIQAQQSVADAHENYISSLLASNLAKTSLCRALGQSEKNLDRIVLGRNGG
jgi:outer membrane protein TolC